MSMEREMGCGGYPRISLAACRVNARMTKTEMAYRLDVSPVMVEAWEKGEEEPELEQLRKISEISGVPMNLQEDQSMEWHKKEIIRLIEGIDDSKLMEFLYRFIVRILQNRGMVVSKHEEV